MAKKSIAFYGTRRDMVEIVQDLVGGNEIDLVRAGSLAEQEVQVLEDVNELSDFTTYLVAYRGSPMHFEKIPLKHGGRVFALDQSRNPCTVAFRTGGAPIPERLLPGSLGTMTDTKESDDLFKICSKLIRRRFEKIQFMYVGTEAATLLDSGGRLSITLKSPPEYDLIRQTKN